jgi:hypothetical protein
MEPQIGAGLVLASRRKEEGAGFVEVASGSSGDPRCQLELHLRKTDGGSDDVEQWSGGKLRLIVMHMGDDTEGRFVFERNPDELTIRDATAMLGRNLVAEGARLRTSSVCHGNIREERLRQSFGVSHFCRGFHERSLP